MKKLVALLLAGLMIIGLVACGGSSDGIDGKYTATTVESFGEEVNVNEVYPNGDNYIEISGSKITITLGGDPYETEYKKDGNKLTMDIEGVEVTATIDGSKIALDLMGIMTVNFEK